MANKIVAQAPPTANRRRNATTEVDQLILAASKKPMRPFEVATALGIPTHQVATRMKMLTERGLMERHRNANQINGPGASTYQAVRKRVAA